MKEEKKSRPNLIVYSDVWMPMMDKNLSTTEEADTIENENYSEKNSIILWYDAFDAFHMVDEIALYGSEIARSQKKKARGTKKNSKWYWKRDFLITDSVWVLAL